MNSIGNTIKYLRSSAGLKQGELAASVGVSANYLSMVERGTREPSVSLLESVARVLRVPVGLFFVEGLPVDGGSATANSATTFEGRLRGMLFELAGVLVQDHQTKKHQNLHDLATQLALPPQRLAQLAENYPRYMKNTIRTGSGKERVVYEPTPELKSVQRAIHSRILLKQQFPSHVHAYLPGRSYITNAQSHKGARYFLLLDIADFFPSTSYRMIRSVFQRLGYTGHALQILMRLTTFRKMLPQGVPTSPLLANLVLLPTDENIVDFCSDHGLIYTRYSDDLTISSAHDFASDVEALVNIVLASGYKLSKKKTSGYFGADAVVTVTGVEIEKGMLKASTEKVAVILDGLSRVAESGGKPVAQRKSLPSFASLRGSISSIKQIDPKVGSVLGARLEKVATENPAWVSAS